MWINQVCTECQLTKKAVEYYEKQGLISPEVGGNGYREYGEKEISTLQEIAVLRKLGVGISDIRTILASTNKAAALGKLEYLMELSIQKASAQQACLRRLAESYDIAAAREYISAGIDELFTIKEKLVHAFPGTYGMYLSIHFGPFLNERIDSSDKEEAYSRIVDYLDHVGNLNLPRELGEFLENCFAEMHKTDMEKMNSAMQSALDNVDEYIADNKGILEEYIQVRTSDEYKETPAYKMQQLLLAFQRSSGYYDIFLPNLKILSKSYCEYMKKLAMANEVFMERYPQTKGLIT